MRDARCALARLGVRVRGELGLSQTEVGDFDVPVLIHEQIAALQVAVHDRRAPRVQVAHPPRHLRRPAQHGRAVDDVAPPVDDSVEGPMRRVLLPEQSEEPN